MRGRLRSPVSAAGAGTGTPVEVTGTAALGGTLTAAARAGWTVTARQWTRTTAGGTVDIPGATGTTYTLTAPDVGATIGCRATGSATAVASIVVPAPPPPEPLAAQPRLLVAVANTAVNAAFLSSMAPIGTVGSKAASFALNTASVAGGYGWIAVPLALVGSAVTFTSAKAPGLPGGWDGANQAGAGGGAVGSRQVVADAGGQQFAVYRQDFPNANDGANADTWTLS